MIKKTKTKNSKMKAEGYLTKTKGNFSESKKDNFDDFKIAMKKAGFKVGNSFDASMTQVAIKTFQKLNGLKITNKLDTATKNKLGL